MALVLGLGSDEAATTLEVRDAATGRLLTSAAATHPARPGGVQHPEDWWDGMVDAVAAADLRHEVASVAVAAQRQALVLLDGAGSPILPASLRTDPCAVDTAPILAKRLGPEKLAKATGQVPGADSPLTRLAAVLALDGRLVERVAAVLGATEQLTYRLTGRLVVDRGPASGSGWWSPSGGRWVIELLDRAIGAPPGGWASRLAEVVGPGEVADRMRATTHAMLGLRGRPLVAVGTDDLMARALAAAVPPGQPAALLDGDAVAVAVADEPVVDPTGAVLSFADATGRHLPTVTLPAVGPVLDSAGRLLGTDAHGLAALAADAPDTDPAGAPTVVGFHRGGPTGRLHDRPGAVLGLRAEHGPGDLALACLRGVAYELLLAIERVGDGGARAGAGPIVLAGADAATPGLAAAVADIAGSPVVVGPAAPAATGACVLAAAALDGVDPLEVVAAWGLDAGTEVEPSGRVDGAEVRTAIEEHRRSIETP